MKFLYLIIFNSAINLFKILSFKNVETYNNSLNFFII